MVNSLFSKARGILFDLDGVVSVGRSAIPGAPDTLRYLRDKGIPFRFLTNTTTDTSQGMHEWLTAAGIPIEKDEILTTPSYTSYSLSDETGTELLN